LIIFIANSEKKEKIRRKSLAVQGLILVDGKTFTEERNNKAAYLRKTTLTVTLKDIYIYIKKGTLFNA
jgi:hypothetical protein